MEKGSARVRETSGRVQGVSTGQGLLPEESVLVAVVEVLRRSPVAAGKEDFAPVWAWIEGGGARQAPSLAAVALDWLCVSEKAGGWGGSDLLFSAVENADKKQDVAGLTAFQVRCFEDEEPGLPQIQEGAGTLGSRALEPNSAWLDTASLLMRRGGLEKRRGVEWLREVSVGDGNPPEIRIQALHLLFEAGDDALDGICRQILSQGNSPQVQVAALYLSAALGNGETLGWLEALSFEEGTPLSKARFRAVSKLRERLHSARVPE